MNKPFSLVLWALIGICSLSALALLAFGVVVADWEVSALNLLAVLLATAAVVWLLSRHAAWPQPLETTPRSWLSDWWAHNAWWVAAWLWGATVSTEAAQVFFPAISLMDKIGLPIFLASYGGAYPEEFFKAVGVLVIALSFRHLTRPWHTFMVGFMVGLGFELAENCLYSVTLGYLDPTSDLSGAFSSWGTRMLVGLFLHPLFTAIVGYGLGQALYREGWSPRRRVWTALGFYLIAFTLHFAWNLDVSNEALRIGIPIAVGVVVYGLGIYLMWRAHRDATHDHSYSVTTTALAMNLSEVSSHR